MITAYERFHAATHMIRAAADLAFLTPTGPCCHCCERPWADVEEPDRAVAYRYDPSMAWESLCTTCYTARIGSFKVLGTERMAGHSSTRVPGKLCMLRGGGAVVTAHAELHLALPRGFIDKFHDGLLGQQGQLHGCSPMQLLLRLRANGRLGDCAQGIVFIERFGLKADVLMNNLKITTDWRELWCNSDSGARATDLRSLIRIAKALRTHGLAEQGVKAPFWKHITAAAEGAHDPGAFRQWVDETPGAADLIRALPVNPDDRINLHRKLRPILEAM